MVLCKKRVIAIYSVCKKHVSAKLELFRRDKSVNNFLNTAIYFLIFKIHRVLLCTLENIFTKYLFNVHFTKKIRYVFFALLIRYA